MLPRVSPATVRDISKVAIAECRWCIQLYRLARIFIGAPHAQNRPSVATSGDIYGPDEFRVAPTISAAGSELQSGLQQLYPARGYG